MFKVLIIKKYKNLPQVTSDCKPWPKGNRVGVCKECGTIQKIADSGWFRSVNKIYKNYNLYHQSGGLEQAVFTAKGKSIPRSEKILKKIKRKTFSKILDFGCGNGNTLQILSSLFKNARLFGADIHKKNLKGLRKIKRFEHLYCVQKEKIKITFDLITAFHSIEHVLSPGTTIKQLLELLSPGGCMLIQVPDIRQNPYDLLVADHRSHFSEACFARLLQEQGINNFKIHKMLVPKELSIFIWKKGFGKKNYILKQKNEDLVKNKNLVLNYIEAFQQQIAEAKRLRKKSSLFGVFGSSVAGIWLNSALNNSPDFFCDEDPRKYGRLLYQKPIFSPQSLQKKSIVYIPMAPKIASLISKRNKRYAMMKLPTRKFIQ
jgi:trans-aconitate methyltransferase